MDRIDRKILDLLRADSRLTGEQLGERVGLSPSAAHRRVKALEEQNASLKAEVASLRERLRRFEHLDAHLSRTGRLLPA